jgi:hypothetical protein
LDEPQVDYMHGFPCSLYQQAQTSPKSDHLFQGIMYTFIETF